MTLRFENDRKHSFLWRSGFFTASHIGQRGSPFKVEPDIWKGLPEDIDSRANFTPLIILDVASDPTTAPQSLGYSEIAKDATTSLLSELEKTAVYSRVEHSDLMESREYLHIVLWELVQNVIDHAGATNAIIAAQIFYKGGTSGDPALSGLGAQHYMEEEHCELSIRRNWLKENRERDYLMLTCVDNGIGIPASLRRKRDLQEQLDDKQLLGSSFQRESSDHDTFEFRYAIHGLHLIAQLVSSYQGYLFAQSGRAFFEITQQDASPSALLDDMALPGTAFQILLPLTAGEPRPYVEPIRSNRSARSQVGAIYATEELRKQAFPLPPPPEQQQPAVDRLIRTVLDIRGPLFLDFVGMPRERHFNSLLLLCVRRKKTDYPVIVLNASDELFTAVRGLRSPTSGIDLDSDLQSTDRALATDLTRGEGSAMLPLVVAITRLRGASQSDSGARLSQPGIAIQWLGIAGDGPHGLGPCLVGILDALFRSEGGVDESILEEIAVGAGKPDGTARTLLRNIQRANPNLVFYSSGAREWSLSFNASSLYFNSVESLTQQLRNAVDSLARFDNPTGAIFFLNWRSDDSYLRNYYQLWKVARDPELARIAGTLLLRQAHEDLLIGPQIARLSALISVTASAGLIAREIARILRIPHWEAASVYDLKKAEWPRDFAGEQVLIVDDLIDTGTASRMVIEELGHRKAKCAGVLSVLASAEGCEARESLRIPIVCLMEVELGRPTHEEVKAAESIDMVLDVDPHTLVPTSRKLYGAAGKGRLTTRNDLSELARHGGLRSGHFVYGGHHYYEFFDIVRYMDTHEGFEDLRIWFIESIRNWHANTVAPVGGTEAPVAVIYPYYSPIAAFLHRIRASLQAALAFPCSIHVACPYQRSRQRVGYRVDSLGANDRFAVFVDDGIASGGTLSEVVDEFVSIHNGAETNSARGATRARGRSAYAKAAILVLPVFDRIGMTPRKHLKSIDRYHGSVRFEFLPKYSLNLRAYYAKDCPLCRINSDIEAVYRTHEHVRQQLEATLEPVRHLLMPTYLTAIATCAPAREMGLLSKEDIATVVFASDALFSDLTSGSDIKKSIEDPGKSPIARLEILLSVMIDPILYRSVHDDSFLIGTVIKELWHGEVSCKYRSYFLMHVPYVHSENLARRILLDAIPKSLADKDKPQPIELNALGGLRHLTPTQYFDAHPEVFACILMGTWLLRNHEEELSKQWDAEWRHALRDTPYGHQFVCGTSPKEEEVARAFAEMLLCNFVTHYKDHHEAFQSRLGDLRNLIAAGLRMSPIPKHSLVYLMNAIDTVRDHYDLQDGLLSAEMSTEILSLYDAWLAGDDPAGSRLETLLITHFSPVQTIDDPTIRRQLRDGLAPTVDEVITKAKANFGEWLRDQARKATPPSATADQLAEADQVADSLLSAAIFSNEVGGLRVFGNTHFIVLTVAHFLRNAFESGMRRDESLSSARPEIALTAEKITHNARSAIRIAVANAQVLTKDEIDGCFRAGGGLMAQKQENERWSGKMGGYPSDNGRTTFFLDLEVVEMARKGTP